MGEKRLLVVTGWLVPEANEKPSKIIEAEIKEELETTLTPGMIPYLQKIEKVSVLSMTDPDELQVMDEANKEWAEAWKKGRRMDLREKESGDDRGLPSDLYERVNKIVASGKKEYASASRLVKDGTCRLLKKLEKGGK